MIGKLITKIVIFPARLITSAMLELPAFEHMLEENSIIYPTPIIFKTHANKPVFKPVFSTKDVIVFMISIKPSTQEIKIIIDPTMLIKTASSGFNGLIIKYAIRVKKPMPIILNNSVTNNSSL